MPVPREWHPPLNLYLALNPLPNPNLHLTLSLLSSLFVVILALLILIFLHSDRDDPWMRRGVASPSRSSQ